MIRTELIDIAVQGFNLKCDLNGFSCDRLRRPYPANRNDQSILFCGEIRPIDERLRIVPLAIFAVEESAEN